MPWVAINVDALVKNLLTDFGLSTRRGERTATLFSAARVEIELKESDEIGDCLRFENRWINSRLQHARITRVESFANGFVCDARRVEFRNVEMVSQKVS